MGDVRCHCARALPTMAAMRRHVLLFGGLCGLLVTALKWAEYHWLVVAHAFEIYAALVAVVFAALGLWLGRRLTRTAPPGPAAADTPGRPPPMTAPTVAPDPAQVQALGLTPRELQILQRMAEGLSNKEIAARLGVTENTVKTHAGRVYDKLGARRRTQAVQLARQQGLIG